MRFSLLFLLVTLNSVGFSQQVTLVATLNSTINETSGLISINQQLITHNDSGGEAALFEVDSVTGNFTRKVYLSNANNNDWEDICTDSLYIYIGDFGNNNGSRTNLKIYRVLIADYLNTPNDTVTADILNFSYADQTNFTPSSFSTNFDAEAIIAINDSLYIFTKNWGNYWTNIYVLPKTPGTFQATKIDSINAQGLVTGATYNTTNNTIGLVGYTFTSAFFIKISLFSNNQFSGGTVVRNLITVPASFQVESITHKSSNEYYLTAEEHSSGSSSLYRLTEQTTNINEVISSPNYIYPNPASKILHLKFNQLKIAEIYNLSGILVYQTKSNKIDVSKFKKGIYFVKLTNTQSNKSVFQKLLIN
jgi:hypothetical protein